MEVSVSRRVFRSRAPLALVLGAALAAPQALTAPVSAAGQYSVTALKFTVQAGGRRCAVDADLYRPAGVDSAHRAPAVLATNGFGGSKSDGTTDAIGKALASRGYVSLIYSGLGFGRSGCLISLDDPGIDGTAASRLIDFLGGKRAADDGTRADFVTLDGTGDPRVGMIGGSYGGAIQLATAAVDHRVDALIPFITWNDLAYALDPNNAGGTVPGAFKWQWTNGFYLLGEGQVLSQPNLDPSRINSLTCLHFVTRACATIHTLNSGSYRPAPTAAMLAYAHSVSPASYLNRVQAPTLLIQGQADSLFNLNEATATYKTLKAQGTPAAMIWQSWGHSGGMVDGELNLTQGNLDTSYVGRRIMSWFDHYLGGQHTDTGPAFAYYRDWITDPAHAYATAEHLPALSRKLYLSGDGKLVDNSKKVALGSRTYANRLTPTSHSETSLAALGGLPDPAPFDTEGTYLAWTSEPLARTTDVAGAPRATLRVDSPQAAKAQDSGNAADRLVLFAKLYDVAPDGTKTLVHRLVAPVRVPDVTKSFTVSLPGIVHRYQKGHRLQFVIA
ncbi:MAG: CocE/NonD family hydrolase, partial [Streptomyces sp.]|nr:CocE/NonD family hydrolase [Streptomyces sp.]